LKISFNKSLAKIRKLLTHEGCLRTYICKRNIIENEPLKHKTMKNVIALILVISLFGTVAVTATEYKKSNLDAQTEMQILPYGVDSFIPMLPIIQNDEYTVYRTESEMVANIPSCQPVGKNYRYFVYKNGEFLMTVNECNKAKVFEFFNAENEK